MEDMSKKQADRRIAMRDAHAQERDQQQGKVRRPSTKLAKKADAQIERSNDQRSSPMPLNRSTRASTEQQKQRFAESIFGGDRERGS